MRHLFNFLSIYQQQKSITQNIKSKILKSLTFQMTETKN